MLSSFWGRRGLPSVAVVLLLAGVSAAAEKPAGLRAAELQQVESAVRAEMGRLQLPGVSVAIADDLRLAWTGGFGMADLENSVPANGATMYRLGSISKPITAVAVLQLAERGKLNLDAPIQTYVPSFPLKPWPITPRELLGHLSGIRHYKSLAEINNTRHYTDLIHPLKIFENDPLLFEPGTRYSYSSYGYALLGAAVQGASGQKFLDYIREHIFEPAGMDRIRQDDLYQIIAHRARGYRRALMGGWQNCDLADTSNKIPAGGLVSTAADLVRFADALEAGRLVSKATLEQMFTPQHTRDGKSTNYGLGWRIFDRGGEKWIGHSGAQQGVSTFLLSFPGRGLAVAVMANLEGVSLAPLATRIADVIVQ